MLARKLGGLARARLAALEAVEIKGHGRHHDGEDRRGLPRGGSLVLGSLILGATVEGERRRKGLPSIFPDLKAAEPVEGDEGGAGGKEGTKPSRRARFNFIADVVEETANCLVYIEIKVSRSGPSSSRDNMSDDVLT